MSRLWLVLFALLFSTAAMGLAQGPALLEVGRFSAATEGSTLPDGWKPLTFKKIERHTQYEMVKDGPSLVVKAISDASASGLTKAVMIDPREYPIVRWRWIGSCTSISPPGRSARAIARTSSRRTVRDGM